MSRFSTGLMKIEQRQDASYNRDENDGDANLASWRMLKTP